MDTESTQLQQDLIASFLGPDPAPFETLISHLMFFSNERRSHHELLFNLCKQSDPNSLSLKLAQILQFSPHLDARATAAILLRKQLTRDDSCLWPRLSSSTQSSLKSILLWCIQREDAKTISKKLCDTVSELASSILPENGWPELLPFMFQSATSDSEKLQEAAFLIFSQLAQYNGETLVPHIKHLHSVILQCLTSSSSYDVKTVALTAAINFIQCLSNSADRDRFQDLLPTLTLYADQDRFQILLPSMMMRTLTEALNCRQEATGQGALVLLIQLAGTEPRFLGRQLGNAVESMLQIAEDESLEERTRHLAVEFVITLAEAKKRKLPEFKSWIMPRFISWLMKILMKMLLDVGDDPSWHSADKEDEDAGEPSNYSVGQECLDRLAISLGGNDIIPIAWELLPEYLVAPEWQKHHAALIVVNQIAEGCSRVLDLFLLSNFVCIIFFSTFIKCSGYFVGVVLFPPIMLLFLEYEFG